ncbi:MAG: antirestriction protein ArdA [Thermoguttaceae bacterium]|nr:antirestriction protein ArdA [Thermoguttaceae bacterium]
MQKLAVVQGVHNGTGCVETFYLPIQDEERKAFLKDFVVKVPDEYAGSRDEAKCYIRKYLTDDEELPKLVDLPSNLYELDDFLSRWSALDASQKQTTVALVEYEVEPLEALRLAEERLAELTDVADPYGDAARNEAVGEYYLEYLLSLEYFGKVPEFFRAYFDAEAFGRDVQLSGGDGFWSEICGRWLDYPQGTYKNRLWYDWLNK